MDDSQTENMRKKDREREEREERERLQLEAMARLSPQNLDVYVLVNWVIESGGHNDPGCIKWEMNRLSLRAGLVTGYFGSVRTEGGQKLCRFLVGTSLDPPLEGWYVAFEPPKDIKEVARPSFIQGCCSVERIHCAAHYGGDESMCRTLGCEAIDISHLRNPTDETVLCENMTTETIGVIKEQAWFKTWGDRHPECQLPQSSGEPCKTS
ncbi:hypothetical protein S40288_11368 [Stachybotrys chartarum IBT 40288]|nr:hypothetical protein S40288_11368 [Stachybotrys chartarum IBT 40288]